MANASPTADPPGRLTRALQSVVAIPQRWLNRILKRRDERQIRGFVDRIIGDEAIGWAFDGKEPDRKLLIVARSHGRVIGETLADLPRRDLSKIGAPDDRLGFRLKLQSGLSDRARESLVFEARQGIRSHSLRRARRFRQDAAVAEGPAEAPRGSTVGFLERCSAGVVKGWAVNPSDPETPATVDLFDGELFLGSVSANVERPRLRESGAPFGARGFEFELPAAKVVDPGQVRARIAGRRLDLRRSRSYPTGDPLGGGLEPQSETAAPATPRAAENDLVGLIICGPGASAMVEETLRACAAQTGAQVSTALVGQAAPNPATVFGAGDETALRTFLASLRVALFLNPGQTIAPDLARQVLGEAGRADVIAWNAEGLDVGETPDLATAFGAPSAGLAVRPGLLLDDSSPLAADLARRGLAAVESRAATPGRTWTTLPGRPAAATPRPPGAGRAPEPPRRISLAVWSDWEASLPPVLERLVEQTAGFDVEILVPAEVAAREGLARMDGVASRSLSIRLVDTPSGRGLAGRWEAMGRAATGEVVVFAHGAATPAAGALPLLAAWAHSPDIGCVGCVVEQAGRADEPGDCVVDAVPAVLMAVSRAGLAAAEAMSGFDGPGHSAERGLGERLSRLGRRSIILAKARVALPEGVQPHLVPASTGTPGAQSHPA